tara:strand:+ start:503 stop:772 length:270 start_codon:yes stop_codon:yes gene_type:complete
MISKSEINNIIIASIKEVKNDRESFSLEDIFTGSGSSIESIDIVQIVSAVEDKLEERGFEGYDLFEKIFEHESLTFSDFSNLIEDQLNE